TADLLSRHIVDGRLRRVSRDGAVAPAAGVLEDYGCVAEGFCAVHQLTTEPRWLELAGRLIDVARERFGNGAGGFYDTADDAEPLVTRPADPTDNATRAGVTAVAAAMAAYAALTGRTHCRSAAQEALVTVAPLAAGHARFTGYCLAVAEALASGPYEIAIATDDPVNDPLVHAAHRLAPPGAVVVAGAPDLPGVPLLAGRPRVGGRSTAYVCRGFVCDRPVTDVDALTDVLGARRRAPAAKLAGDGQSHRAAGGRHGGRRPARPDDPPGGDRPRPVVADPGRRPRGQRGAGRPGRAPRVAGRPGGAAPVRQGVRRGHLRPRARARGSRPRARRRRGGGAPGCRRAAPRAGQAGDAGAVDGAGGARAPVAAGHVPRPGGGVRRR